ncbi:MAG: alkaline phosphatase family protein [Gemmatimonadaceae bacterium]|nr:alkaline phosphatase family protein [Gemmatimonadaceae bacterium]
MPAASLKVVAVGFDGLDPRIVERLLAAGALPAFARLAAQGGLARVATTTPAQTPVAWSSFATGLNPGGHGIFDFLRRDPERYLPDLGLSRFEQRSAMLPPAAVNLRSGATIWELASQAGLRSVVLRCPCTFPPAPFRGRLLSGMGVPDLRGGIGTATFLCAGEATPSNEAEIVRRLERDGSTFRSFLTGPARSHNDELVIPLTLTTRGDADGSVRFDSGTVHALREGAWSEWVPIAFRSGLLTRLRGIVRLLLVRGGNDPELYVSPINYDPASPAFPISEPWSYAGALQDAIGAYATLGMPEDHTGLTNSRFDEATFLAQCDLIMQERLAMLRHELGRGDSDFLYCLFDTPDRVQHMFWRFTEPDHPANAMHGLDPAYRAVIDEHYRSCDAILGEVLDSVDDRTTVMVLSDHGFTSFRRAFHVNSWLADHGWLQFRRGVRRGDETSSFFHGVDWSRTRAYATGFGSIYLNVEGREGQGIVPAPDRARVASDLARSICGARDTETDVVAVARAAVRESVYRGSRIDDAPDVILGMANGFRVSWETALGGAPAVLFEHNTRKWAGDHIVSPELVPGVLLMNRPFSHEGATLADCMRSILDLLGVPAPASVEGRSLLPPA